MGRWMWIAAALAAGCGNVAKAPANEQDAAIPDALVCAAPMLACGDTCIDATTVDHCGACDVACTTSEECESGHCTDTTQSCFAIKLYDPSASTGMYTHKADGQKFYCDMATGTQYDTLIMARFDSAPSGFTLISAADLQDAAKQAAFIALYNAQSGLVVQTSWVSGNCCFKNDTTVAQTDLFLKAGNITPYMAGVSTCNPSGGYLTTAVYTFGGGAMGTAPLASDFFTTNPPSVGTLCQTSTNPGMFWKVKS